MAQASPPGSAPKYSVVIPVYNSGPIVGETIDRTIRFFETNGFTYEIILVNDKSRDDSWAVIAEKFAANPRLIAINLLKNYGQHTAVLCGLDHSRGEYVITLDDDLQNPPEEIVHLIAGAEEGHDLVLGRYEKKKHSFTRRLGSRLVNYINRKVFKKPKDLTLTNFRLIHRRVVERVLSHRTPYPYINGLSILYAERPGAVAVDHQPRKAGTSTYSLWKIVELMMRVLFNYTAYPLRVVTMAGVLVALASFLLSGVFFFRALIYGGQVPGWASVAVMLSFFNGMSLLLLGMLGEYLTRILDQVSLTQPYHATEILRHDA